MRVNISVVANNRISPDDIVSSFLGRPRSEVICILDSCGAAHEGSSLLIAGVEPSRTVTVPADSDAETALGTIENAFNQGRAAIFTISYDLGPKMLGIPSRHAATEPLVFIAEFDALLLYDYFDGELQAIGDGASTLAVKSSHRPNVRSSHSFDVRSDFSRSEYMAAIDDIKERIRDGVTYQANLTQKLTATIPAEISSAAIYKKMRVEHPAPFSAYIHRGNSTVISASPERFFSVTEKNGERVIRTSPIKGTRPRGRTPRSDARLRSELVSSAKDRAENTMIVDLLRNDIGRICEFGSVTVERLCDVETHPTYFDLVSTISGTLRGGITISDILRAVFPCGSITGAPKISTMKIIDEIERGPRGLSMGAIGCYIPENFGIGERMDLSVAIRTMTIRGRSAEFNVGGGITIESDPAAEYEETLVKAAALLGAMNGNFIGSGTN